MRYELTFNTFVEADNNFEATIEGEKMAERAGLNLMEVNEWAED